MTTISQMAARWNSLNLHKEVQMSIGATVKDIIKANQEQLFSGKDSEDKELKRYKQEWYRQYKLTKNPADVTDLKDTGEFYKGFFVDVEAERFTLDSTDGKTGELERKYGKPFGLQPESKTKYSFGVFWKDLKPRLEAILKLQFV
jgi:threonyl-tRNA synthetase